ncbi:MAG TPA: phytase [Blastocatellia bacterium]|jgi:3-phytase
MRDKFKGLKQSKFLTAILAIILCLAPALLAQGENQFLDSDSKKKAEKSSDKKSEKEAKKHKQKDKDDEDKDDDDDDEDSDKQRGEESSSKKEKSKKEKSEKEKSDAPSELAKEKIASKSNTEEYSEPVRSAAPAGAIEEVTATVETAPVPNAGDAADDPAIWVDPKDPARSLIIATDKLGGLAVYDLEGKELQYMKMGRVDNVDLRDGFLLGGESVPLVTASNRSDNSIVIYKLNTETRKLENVEARKITTVTAYGCCMYRSAKTGKFYYFVTAKSGDVEQWELFAAGGKVDAKKVRSLKAATTVEGCVADDELGFFYLAEEEKGIWKFGAEPDAETKGSLIDEVGAGKLVADIEGIAIAYGKNGEGYLIASSQGNNTFVVYKRDGNNEYVKTFRIVSGNIGGVEECDGIEVTTANLGPAFPNGVFVVQDGINEKGNQNFKLVPWEAIMGKKSK